MLRIRDYAIGDKEKVISLVMGLKKFYPTIGTWLKKEITKIESGTDKCKVVSFGDQIGGVAISGPKNEFSVKLKTFYLAEEFRRSGIGAHLLQEVIDYWSEKRIRKIYVTFAEEEVDELLPFFNEYGFLFDGISPFNQRASTSEYIMSKLFVYDEFTEERFKDFVYHHLFRLRGYRLVQEGTDFFVLQKLIAFKESYKIYVKIVTDVDPNPNLSETVIIDAEKLGCISKFIVTYYPLEAETSEDLKVIDGYDIETLFYPLVLRRIKYVGLISPVEPRYSSRILYNASQAQIIPDKKSFRIDNVFYKYPTTHKKVKRGSIFLFYESKPTSAIIGEGKIREKVIDTPENLFGRFKTKGVYELKDLKKINPGKNEVLAFLFGRTIRYENKIPLNKIQEIKPNFNPQGSSFITQEELDKLREIGGIRTV